MNNSNWDDIRFVLAVAKHGSLNAAAGALDVTHATVMRRVAAFEERYQRPLFKKTSSGYAVLPEALPILNAMAKVDEAVLTTQRTIAGSDPSPTGNIRIASTDSLCQLVLPPILGRISARYPGIDITLLSANVHHDLTRLTADIAVRPTITLDKGLIGRHVADVDFGVYCDGRADRKWLRLQGALSGSLAAAWMEEHIPHDQTIGGSDSFLALQQMAVAGVGKVLLPKFVGQADPRLHVLPEENPGVTVPLWIAMHDELAGTPRFALVQELLGDQISAAIENATRNPQEPTPE